MNEWMEGWVEDKNNVMLSWSSIVIDQKFRKKYKILNNYLGVCVFFFFQGIVFVPGPKPQEEDILLL